MYLQKIADLRKYKKDHFEKVLMSSIIYIAQKNNHQKG